jgi:UDP-2,3-diacylglucosamine hydrolase
MKIAIFSDLHLSMHKRQDHEALFIKTLRRLREEDTQELWLLGDIYDLMVGPFAFWKTLHKDFFLELEEWTRSNKKVLWVQGNHDFFISDLLNPMGVQCSDSFIEHPVDNKKIFLAHGDLVNNNDKPYLRWRAFTRSRLFEEFLKIIPEKQRSQWIPQLGEKLSQKSRAQSSTKGRAPLQELFKTFAQQKWHEGFAGVCLGHSHIEENYQVPSQDHQSPTNFYLNLGSWINYSPRYALWDTESYNYPQIERLLD